MTWRIDSPPCVPESDTGEHRHSRRCVVRLMRELPPAPDGWQWVFDHVGRDWALYLRQIGSAGHWWPVGIPVSSSASDLVSVVWAYIQGQRHEQQQRG